MNKVFSWAFAGALICGLNVFTSCNDSSDNPTPPSPEKEVSSEAVYKFFKEINGVPRPSMHEEKIRQYLIDFANARGLRFIEADGNIIIYKDATSGMEEAPTAILQTHMDMVCVAADGYDVDFLTTGIEQEDSDGFIHSKDYVTSPWSPDINSPLVNYASKVYQDIHGYPIEMFIVGGSVECSIFSETYPDVQIISYGPTVLDAHTIRESVDISSVEDTWDYTLCLLRQFNELK